MFMGYIIQPSDLKSTVAVIKCKLQNCLQNFPCSHRALVDKKVIFAVMNTA